MKKYRIQYKGQDSLKEDLGADFVTFVCDVYPEGKEKSFLVSIAFYELKRRLYDLDPQLFTVIEKVENGIKKWGIHDSDTIRELEECGINFKASSGTNEAANVFKGLQEFTFDIKTDTENYNLICTRIEKILTNEIMELFPVIFNSSSKSILGFEKIMLKHIPDIAEDLCGLIRDARE